MVETIKGIDYSVRSDWSDSDEFQGGWFYHKTLRYIINGDFTKTEICLMLCIMSTTVFGDNGPYSGSDVEMSYEELAKAINKPVNTVKHSMLRLVRVNVLLREKTKTSYAYSFNYKYSEWRD